MERLRKRSYFYAGILTLSGFFITLLPKKHTQPKDEEWMAQNAPYTVGKYSMLGSEQQKKNSYVLDDTTYKKLKPDGILARVYEMGDQKFDVVLVLSRDSDSFHDPRVCFSGQGWVIDRFSGSTIHTRTRGTVPITLVQMHSETGGKKMAAFTYKGKERFYGSTQKFKLGMVARMFKGNFEFEGTFMRFIPIHENASERELKEFLSEYFEASKITSHGFF